MSRFLAARSGAKPSIAMIATLAFIAVGCGSGDPESLAEPLPDISEARPLVARQIGEPTSTPVLLDAVASTTTTTAPSSTTTAPTTPVVNVEVSVIGSIRTVPTDPASADDALVDRTETVVATLGCTRSTGCEPTDIAAWAANRVDVVNLAATTAALDGATVLNEQSAALVANGVATVGFGADLAEALTPVLLGTDDNQVAIYAINLDEDLAPSLIATETSPGIAGGAESLALLLDLAGESLDRGHEVIVLTDFDRADDRSPQTNALDQTQVLVDAGVQAVVGHGSDFLQRFERLDESAVAFNLGNAVTASDEPLRRDTAVFNYTVMADDVTACLQPATGGPEGLTIDEPQAVACE